VSCYYYHCTIVLSHEGTVFGGWIYRSLLLSPLIANIRSQGENAKRSARRIAPVSPRFPRPGIDISRIEPTSRRRHFGGRPKATIRIAASSFASGKGKRDSRRIPGPRERTKSRESFPWRECRALIKHRGRLTS